MKERLLTVFYHRGRKQFVPWTFGELCNRVNCAPDDLANELRGLHRCGLVVARHMHGKADSRASTWNLTQAGMIEARAIMAAQEMARSS